MALKLASKKCVLLRCVDEDDVINHIVHVKEKKIGIIKDIKFERSKIQKSQREPELEHDVYVPATELLAEQNDVQGKEMFNFSPSRTIRSSSKKGSKIKLSYARHLTTKNQLKNAEKKLSQARSNSQKKTNHTGCGETSKYQLRARIKQELVSMKGKQADSDFEDADDNESWGENSETDDTDEEIVLSPDARSKKNASVMRSYAEDYFFAHKQSKSLTSNRMLSKLNVQKSDIKKMEEILKDAFKTHQKEAQSMLQNYYRLFDKWMFLLSEGFNVLLYGVGSKYGILQKFGIEVLRDNLYIVVNGFFPTLSVKQILCSITEDALEYKGTFSNVYDHVDYIKNFLASGEEELFIIVHNIDGAALRGTRNQSVLGMLAAMPHVHFLASVDHINSPLIWDQINLSNFNWIWYDVSTFAPYILETSFDDSLLTERSGHLVLSSLLHVFRSLTPNGQGVFLILAKEQLGEKGNNNYLGMTLHEWYQKCRKGFLVNSELTMQAQLTEFKDHKLLSSRKSANGIEYLYIPVDSDTLEQFLEKENS